MEAFSKTSIYFLSNFINNIKRGVILKGMWYTFQRSKHEMMMVIDSLPKLNSFFFIKLELGIKIFSLVLTLLGYWPPSLILAFAVGFYDNTSPWIVYVPVLVNVITFGLASFALLWNKTRQLLIPAAVLAPFWSFFSLIFVMVVPGLQLESGNGDGAFIFAVHLILLIPLFLLYSILLAYYWVGLITLYGLKKPAVKPSDQGSLKIEDPATTNEVDNKGGSSAHNKMNIKEIMVDIKESLAEIETKISFLQQ